MRINPKQMAMRMLNGNMGNNPILRNVLGLANKGDMQGIEQVARNLCKERGISADEAFRSLKNKFGI